jgi:mRNA interferase HigB
MRVITWRPLKEFAEVHPAALTPLKVWRKLVESSEMETPADVKRIFGTSVDFLPGGIVIFDIGGNKYRLAVNIRYRMGKVFIRHVMTHAEYDRRTREGTL